MFVTSQTHVDRHGVVQSIQQSVPIPCGVAGLCSQETPQLAEDKIPINFTSVVSLAGTALYRTTWGNWTRGVLLCFSLLLILEVPNDLSQWKFQQQCVKPLCLLAGPEWFVHWLIISCYNPASMWPQYDGRQWGDGDGDEREDWLCRHYYSFFFSKGTFLLK